MAAGQVEEFVTILVALFKPGNARLHIISCCFWYSVFFVEKKRIPFALVNLILYGRIFFLGFGHRGPKQPIIAQCLIKRMPPPPLLLAFTWFLHTFVPEDGVGKGYVLSLE